MWYKNDILQSIRKVIVSYKAYSWCYLIERLGSQSKPKTKSQNYISIRFIQTLRSKELILQLKTKIHVNDDLSQHLPQATSNSSFSSLPLPLISLLKGQFMADRGEELLELTEIVPSDPGAPQSEGFLAIPYGDVLITLNSHKSIISSQAPAKEKSTQ